MHLYRVRKISMHQLPNLAKVTYQGRRQQGGEVGRPSPLSLGEFFTYIYTYSAQPKYT